MTTRTTERLRRILALLPYAIQHPGTTVEELAERFGVPSRQVLADLNLVELCGLPGYTPDVLIEVAIQDGGVYVRTADYFERPLRITPVEALALYAGAAALAELPGMEQAESLRSGLRKLGAALGPAGVNVELEPGAPSHLEALRSALNERRRVRLEYYSTTRGELTARTVDPWGLIATLGRFYLIGYDHLSGEERMFRADRIKAVELLDEGAAGPPEDFDPGGYRGAFKGEGRLTLTLELSPRAASWFEDYYPVTRAEDLPGGRRRVELPAGGLAWAALLALRLGADGRIVGPSEVLGEARRLAREIAARYRI
jgi:proteasome accessory factor C